MELAGAKNPHIHAAHALFRLMDLPNELIYRVLNYTASISTKDHPIVIGSVRKRNNPQGSYHPQKYNASDERLFGPPIAKTCRFLRTESLKIFPASNYFTLDGRRLWDVSAMTRWLVRLSDEQLRTLGAIPTNIIHPPYDFSVDTSKDERFKKNQSPSFWSDDEWPWGMQFALGFMRDMIFPLHAFLTQAGYRTYVSIESGRLVLQGKPLECKFGLLLVRLAGEIPDATKWLLLQDARASMMPDWNIQRAKWWGV